MILFIKYSILVICIIVFIVINFTDNYFKQRKRFNKGKCIICGSDLKFLFAGDKHKYYRCTDNEKHKVCYVSYNVESIEFNRRQKVLERFDKI